MKRGEVLAWHEVAEPDGVVFERELSYGSFAADLYAVVSGEAHRDYRDPERFFERTYPTEGMVHLLGDIASRLAGRRGGAAVIQLETPFGGGKTHSLIALYHFFTSPESRRTDLGRKVCELEGLKPGEIPLLRAVPVFVGTVPDPLKGKTPWGLIAEQLGRYEIVKEHDRSRVSPGREVLRKVLGEEPLLILIDEIAEYTSRAPDDLRRQIFAFCQELTEMASLLPRCAVVVTLPTSAPYDETIEEGGKVERASRELKKIFGRMQAIHEPVRGLEIYEIVRRRLFDFPEGWEADAREVVDEYMGQYRRWGDAPEWAQSEEYRDRMLSAYPFHPLLIDWLHQRWGSYATFQRTRGVLYFLALVVRDLWERKEEVSPPLIQPSHVNLFNSQIARELLRHIGQEFESVIEADVRERASRVDGGMGDWAKFRIATGIATSLFMSSFTAGEEKRGISLPELKVAVWTPGMEPALITDTLERLRGLLLYLNEREGLFRFGLEPSLIRARMEQEERLTEEEIEKELRQRIKALLEEKAGWTVRFDVRRSRDVPDARDLQLVLLPPDLPMKEARKLAREILERAGDRPRTYRNAVVVVLPDEDALWGARQAIKEYLAWRRVRGSELKDKFSKDDRKRLEEYYANSDSRAGESVAQVYRHIALFTENGIEVLDMGTLAGGESLQIPARVREFLKRQDLLMDETVNPKQVRELMGEAEEKPLKEVWDAYGKFPRLPILLDKKVLAEAVREGVKEELFAVRIQGREYYGPEASLPRGDRWVDTAVLLKEPKKPVVKPPAAITVDDILRVLDGEERPVRDVYRELWREKHALFASEASFKEAFRNAIDEGKRQRRLEVRGFVGEAVDFETLLRQGRLRPVKETEAQPPAIPKAYTLRIRLPLKKMGMLLSSLVSWTGAGFLESEQEVELVLGTTELDEERRQNFQRILRETLEQVEGRLVEPSDWAPEGRRS